MARGNSALSSMPSTCCRTAGQGRFEVYKRRGHLRAEKSSRSFGCSRSGCLDQCPDARSNPGRINSSNPLDLRDYGLRPREGCVPIWPGKPILAHWGSPNPAAVEGSEEIKNAHSSTSRLQSNAGVDLRVCIAPEQFEPTSRAGDGDRRRSRGKGRWALCILCPAAGLFVGRNFGTFPAGLFFRAAAASPLLCSRAHRSGICQGRDRVGLGINHPPDLLTGGLSGAHRKSSWTIAWRSWNGFLGAAIPR